MVLTERAGILGGCEGLGVVVLPAEREDIVDSTRNWEQKDEAGEIASETFALGRGSSREKAAGLSYHCLKSGDRLKSHIKFMTSSGSLRAKEPRAA